MTESVAANGVGDSVFACMFGEAGVDVCGKDDESTGEEVLVVAAPSDNAVESGER